MAAPVRVGIIGTSGYTEFMHIGGIGSHPQARIEAICGRNREKAEAVAAKHGIARVCTDYREMLQSGGLDAVVVAAPDDQHFPMVMEALDRGLHVICEKPLATDANQARQMYLRARSAGVVHMTYFTWRWLPHVAHLIRRVQEGYVGRCCQAVFRFTGQFGRSDRYAWRFDARHGGGVLGDLGSHMIDLAHLVVGEITEVTGQVGTLVDHPETPEPANDAATLSVRFAGGAQGLFQLNAVAPMGERHMQMNVILQGELGSLEFDFALRPDTAQLLGARFGGSAFERLEMPPDLWDFATDGAVRNVWKTRPVGGRLFIDSILAGGTVESDFRAGWQVQRVIDAALESDRTGRRVLLGPEPD